MRNVYINAFVRESSERDGPNFSKVSSVTSEITRSYRVLRLARNYRAGLAIFNLQCRVHGNLWKYTYASVMLVQCLYFERIYIGLYMRKNMKSFDSL